MKKYEDKLQEQIQKKINKQTNNTIKKARPCQHSPINYKPWYQGDDSPSTSKEIKDPYNPAELENILITNKEKETVNTQNFSNKVDAKWMQSRCKVDAKLDAKWMQSGCKVDAEKVGFLESGCKVDAQVDAALDAKWMQSRCKVDAETNKITTYASLVGVERAFVFLIYNECQKIRSKVTGNLTIEHIQSIIKAKKSSIKSASQRLEKKGVIKRISFKTGRGGWSRYTMNDLLCMELLHNESGCKVDAKWMQSGCKVDAQVDAQVDAASVVSSYIINNKLLTTTALPEEYKILDFSCLTNIGFDESHVIQIHREYTKKPELTLSPEIIQNSINAFAFDLKHNNISNDFKGSPTVVLTSLLKKGQPYSSKTPEKVLTPQEEAMQEYLAAQEKKQQKTTEIKTKAKDSALQEWLDSLSTEEILAFNQEPRPEGMPDKIYQSSKRKKALEFAKDYFNTVLWPDKLKQILNNVEKLNTTKQQM